MWVLVRYSFSHFILVHLWIFPGYSRICLVWYLTDVLWYHIYIILDHLGEQSKYINRHYDNVIWISWKLPKTGTKKHKYNIFLDRNSSPGRNEPFSCKGTRHSVEIIMKGRASKSKKRVEFWRSYAWTHLDLNWVNELILEAFIIKKSTFINGYGRNGNFEQTEIHYLAYPSSKYLSGITYGHISLKKSGGKKEENDHELSRNNACSN